MATQSKKYEIGQEFWKYDPNTRRYTRDDGTRSSSPIPIKSYVKFYFIGETSRSWLVSRWKDGNAKDHDTIKIPKSSSMEEYGFLDSWGKVEEVVWVADNKREILGTWFSLRLNKDQLLRIKNIIEENQQLSP
jgi:hypothetical protein